jgi:hypothetical protein
MSATALESNIKVSQKTKSRITICNTLLGIYAKECTPGYERGTCTPMFIVALFTIAKYWTHPRCPKTDE